MKKSLRYLLLLIIIATSILVAVRWQAWFGLSKESPYEIGAGIHRVLMVPGPDGLHDRYLSWVSGDSLPSTFLMDGESYQIFPKRIDTDGGVTYIYSHSLKGLKEGTHYPYEIQLSGATFCDTISVLGTSTWERFVVIGDIQDREIGVSSTLMQGIYERYPNSQSWVFLGDLLERGHDKYWEIFYDGVNAFASKVPFVPVLGNHEYSKGFHKKPDPRWSLAFPIYTKDSLSTGTNVGIGYCVDYKFARLVVLDTNQLPLGILHLLPWLYRTLKDRQDDPFIIVAMHHGVHSMAQGRINLAERLILAPLLKMWGVHLVLQGHDHVYARMRKEHPQDPLYITHTTSLKSYGVKPDPVRLESSSGKGRFYMILDVDKRQISGSVYGEDHHLFDHFTIEK